MKRNENVFSIRLDFNPFEEGSVIKSISGNFFYVWRVNSNLAVIETLPKNKILRLVKEIYFDILSIFYRKNLHV